MGKSKSLWYARYVGDYQRKTSHLSLTEHGAYTLLLDHYYSTGKPLTANAEQLHRICRAFEPHEQAAVQTVLWEFFVVVDNFYHNQKADDELVKRSEISGKRRNAALSKGDNCFANGEQLEVHLGTQPQPQPHIRKKEESHSDLGAVLESTTARLRGRSGGNLPKHERKAIWQSNICKEAERTMPRADYEKFLVGFANNEPFAKRIAEKIDKTLKGRAEH